MSSTEAPQIHLHLGDTVNQVQSHSSYSINPGRPWLDIDMYIADSPTRVLYESPGHDLAFPVGTYVAFDINKGHVVGLKISPHLKYLGLEQAINLAHQLNDLFQKAGWQLSATPLPLNPSAIHDIFDKDNDTPKRIAVAVWECAGDVATVLVTHQHKSSDAFAKLTDKSFDSFIVTIDMENAKVLQTY